MSDFVLDCNRGGGTYDPDHPFICPNADTFENADRRHKKFWWSTKPETLGEHTGDERGDNAAFWFEWNSHAMRNWEATRTRVTKVCPNVKFEDVWPHFYHPYSDAVQGRPQVDDFIRANADTITSGCIEALKNNDDPENQRKYQALNQYDMRGIPDFFRFPSFEDAWKGHLPNEYWWAMPPLSGPQDYFKVHSFAETATYSPSKIWGNPLWTHGERQQAMKAVLGKDASTGDSWTNIWAQSYVNRGFINPGKTAVDYFDPRKHAGEVNPYDDPLYEGMLPHKPQYAVQNEPWHKATADPDGYGYVDKCHGKSHESMVPYLAAVAGGLIGALVVPGSRAKILAAATGASTMYFFTEDNIGWQAAGNIFTGDGDESTHLSAICLSVGAPMTLAEAVLEMDLLPTSIESGTSEYVILGAAAAAGYFVVLPIAGPALLVTGRLTSLLQAPFAALYAIGKYFADDCWKEMFQWHYKCKCDTAANKPRLAEALVDDVFGCTGQQAKLRKEAMMAAMTNGAWGPDPVKIGECDPNGNMVDVTACISAGEWAYQTWPKDFDKEATAKWNEVKHILDEDNASFRPPIQEDKPCEQFGRYFRWDKTSQSCKDFRAPVGMQGPGQYHWPETAPADSNESCAIL